MNSKIVESTFSETELRLRWLDRQLEAISGFRNTKNWMSCMPSSGLSASFLLPHGNLKNLLELNLINFTQKLAKGFISLWCFLRKKFSFPKWTQRWINELENRWDICFWKHNWDWDGWTGDSGRFPDLGTLKSQSAACHHVDTAYHFWYRTEIPQNCLN